MTLGKKLAVSEYSSSELCGFSRLHPHWQPADERLIAFSEIATGIVRLVIYIQQATSMSTIGFQKANEGGCYRTTVNHIGLQTPTRTQMESAI